LPYLVLICTATVVVGGVLALRVRESYLERTRETLGRQAVLISDLMRGDLEKGDVGAVEAATRRLGETLRCRVTVIEDDGKVIGDNEADPAQMENHRQRGEVVRADANGEGYEERSSKTLGEPLMYFAHKLVTADGKKHFVRVSVHISDLDHQLNLIYGGMAVVVVIATLAAGALSFYFARRGAAPVVELSEFARALGRGELHRRLLLPDGGEISQLAGTLNTMAESVGKLLEQTSKDRAELLAMLGSMSEGVIATDVRQRLVVVNQRAGELLSFNAELSQGKMLWEVVRDKEILKAAAEVLESGERKAFQISPEAGRHLEVTACTYPVGGRPEGLILVAHDTSQSVRYQELRKEFVANVSHELRTPLTVIKGFTETLRDGAMLDPEIGPKFLATIERHVDQLTNLVSDLLELSRLESMPDLPKVVAFDIGAVVKRVMELLMPAAQRKNQSVRVEVGRHVPRLVGNPDYVERAVSNLVDNAIKYTPEGGEIRVAATREGESVVIEVADNGLGIPAPDLVRIFERFYRVDRSRSREMGGTGLGLSIVKHVAQAHGGSIDVSSTPGVGSRFRLRLPVRAENG
jgi:two-component system phosphate regulon sensor histidine kinase PhoR